jgi:hypothetical protein
MTMAAVKLNIPIFSSPAGGGGPMMNDSLVSMERSRIKQEELEE